MSPIILSQRVRNRTRGAGRELVQRWLREYPCLFRACRDSDGRSPRHTWFYPIDEYDPDIVELLAELCRRTSGEVEVHLHHEDDTAEDLRPAAELETLAGDPAWPAACAAPDRRGEIRLHPRQLGPG